MQRQLLDGSAEGFNVVVCINSEITSANLVQLIPGTTVDIAPGRLVTVTVQGNLIPTINPNQTVTNTARAAWTSLNGDLPLIERTGADGPGPDASVLNNYVSQGTVSFNAQNVAIAKAIVSTSETSTTANNLLTIGEIVRYRVALTVPEGQTLNLQIQDILPPGLTFLNDGTATYQTNAPGSLTSSAFDALPGLGVLPGAPTAFDDRHVGSNNSPTADADVFSTGTDVFFKFATLTNTDRNNSTPEQIIVEFNAIADNNSTAESNDAGDVVANRARATNNQNNANLATTPPVNSTIVEPNLSVAKTLIGPPTVQAGGPVSFEVVVSAASGATRTTAFDIVVADNVPAQIENVVVTVTGTTGTVVNAVGTMIGNAVTITAASMAPGSTLTVTIAGTAVADIPLGSTFTNTADLTYTSLPGPNGTTSNPTGSVVPGVSGGPPRRAGRLERHRRQPERLRGHRLGRLSDRVAHDFQDVQGWDTRRFGHFRNRAG